LSGSGEEGGFHAAVATGSAKNAKECHTIITIRLKPPYHKPISLWINPEAIEGESHQPGKLSGGFNGASIAVTLHDIVL